MREIRIRLFIVTIILIAFGMVMIYSASSAFAYEVYKDSTYYLKKHLLFIVSGFFLALVFMSIDYVKLRKFVKPFLLLAIFLLMAVLIPGVGKEAGGAKRWINLGIFSFQPSEVAKLALVFYAADVLSRKQSDIASFIHGFMPLMLVMGVCVVLILAEPDLGTAIAFALLVVIMSFIAEVRMKQLFLISLPCMLAVCRLIAAKPYRLKRITAFLNPWQDPKGAGFQIIQSMVALGSGGLFGVGLAHSKQKLFYLPEAHTDFIFSIIGEELGLVGTLSVVSLYAIFIWLGFKIASHARDLFGQFLAFGLVSIIALHVIINIAAVTGAIPTKGLPLPFISYGGTSLIYNIASVGIILNIARHRK